VKNPDTACCCTRMLAHDSKVMEFVPGDSANHFWGP